MHVKGLNLIFLLPDNLNDQSLLFLMTLEITLPLLHLADFSLQRLKSDCFALVWKCFLVLTKLRRFYFIINARGFEVWNSSTTNTYGRNHQRV